MLPCHKTYTRVLFKILRTASSDAAKGQTSTSVFFRIRFRSLVIYAGRVCLEQYDLLMVCNMVCCFRGVDDVQLIFKPATRQNFQFIVSSQILEYLPSGAEEEPNLGFLCVTIFQTSSFRGGIELGTNDPFRTPLPQM